MQSNPDEASFNDIKEGLDELKEAQTVIFLDDSMFKGYLKSNPTHQQNLEVFWSSESVSAGLIFPLNSPLVPIFRSGAEKINERGVQDILSEKWTGKDINQDSTAATMVLGSGQMILIFAIMLSFYIFCLLMLVVEVAQSVVEETSHKRSPNHHENRHRREQRRARIHV